MRNFFYFCVGLLISVGLFFGPYAHATYVQYNAAGQVVGMLPDATRNTFVETFGVLDKTTGAVVVKGTQVPVSVGTQVGKASIAKAAGKIAAKAIPGVGTGIALAELCTLLCPGNDYRLNPEGDAFQKIEQPGIPSDAVGTGYHYGTVSRWAKTPQLACNVEAQARFTSGGYANGAFPQQLILPATLGANNTCSGYMRDHNGQGAQQFMINASLVKLANKYVPEYILATEVQTEADVALRAEQQARFKPLYDAIMANRASNPTAWPSDYNPVKANTPVSVTAPPVTTPEKTVSTTTKTLPNGSTDTTTTKEKTVITPTTTGTTVGDSKTTFPSQTVTTSTTINNVTNNITTETNTVEHPAEETPEQDDEDLSFVDSDMPDIPELYEQKYPDGIAGVWRDHKPNIAGTQFWQGVRSMFPSFGGGQCPAWSMSFNIMSGANFGSMPFNVPCWIFQAVGLIILTTAAFTARKIIF